MPTKIFTLLCQNCVEFLISFALSLTISCNKNDTMITLFSVNITKTQQYAKGATVSYFSSFFFFAFSHSCKRIQIHWYSSFSSLVKPVTAKTANIIIRRPFKNSKKKKEKRKQQQSTNRVRTK